MSRARRVFALLAVSVLSLGLSPSRVLSQPTPETAAERFFHHLGRLQWEQLSAVLHPTVLADFDLIAHQLAESPRGDRVLAELYDVQLEELEQWSDAETFVRSMEGMTGYARGLMESQVASDVVLLGTVQEGDSLSHVLYREVTDHMGLETEAVSVASLLRGPAGWLVTTNAELEVLKTAFRGIPVARQPPPRG